MFAAERRRQILDIIRSSASVEVSALATRFAVSSSTIRRDLNELHGAALLERTYGGAVAPPPSTREAPFNERSASHPDEKDRIGQAAAALVAPGETIIVDGGTTTESMVRYLRETEGVTVVTFGLNILNALVGSTGVTVIAIGGVLEHRTLTLGGVLAGDALAAFNMRFDRAFLAATGISADEGLTNFGFDEIPLKRRAIELAREVVLLADSSKVGARAAGFIAPAIRIHRLITDAGAPTDQVEALRSLGIKVDLV